jgi:predicted small integral membrane protein
MKIAKLIALLGLLAMTGVLVYGFTVGDFAEEGKQLLSMPWGIVSLVDLYVGFALFSGWIVYREQSLFASIIWVALMMVLGFWTASLYILIALQTSGGDWRRFWMGRRLEERQAQSR